MKTKFKVVGTESYNNNEYEVYEIIEGNKYDLEMISEDEFKYINEQGEEVGTDALFVMCYFEFINGDQPEVITELKRDEIKKKNGTYMKDRVFLYPAIAKEDTDGDEDAIKVTKGKMYMITELGDDRFSFYDDDNVTCGVDSELLSYDFDFIHRTPQEVIKYKSKNFN